ncbi:MAG: tetratricopeptide repeat protein, partial [Treponema sp.]|nr:tetratricopeptide repeat protein [Treponema sp.]
MHRTMFVLSVMLSLPMLFLVSCQEKEVDWNRRIEEYAAKAATNPSDDNALAMLGEAFYRIEDYDSAIENCAKAIELNQNNVRAFSYRGLSYFYRPDSDYDSAFPDLEKAISLSQKNAEVYYGAAYILNQKEQYKEAIDNYDKSIRLDSKKSEFYRNRGIALSNYGFTEEGKPRRTELLNRAITDFKKAVELNPNFRLNYFVLGVNGYYQNGQYDKAIEALTKAYELDPNHGSTVKYLAYSYSRDILGK